MSEIDQPSELRGKVSAAFLLGFGLLMAFGFLYANFKPPTPNRLAPQRECIMHLRLIDGAKKTWALENNKSESDVPTWVDIDPYLDSRANNPSFLKCPSGGIYTIGAVSNKPTCSIPGHALP